VFQTGTQAQILRDPGDRVVHFTVFRGAQVENGERPLNCLDGFQDRVHTVLNIEIRLSLAPITQDAQVFRVFEELPVEIDDVAVRIALSKNGNEAKDESLHAEALAIGGDHPFGGKFGSTVKRGLYGKGAIFGSGYHASFAVDRPGGRKCNAADA